MPATQHKIIQLGTQQEVRRDIKAWQSLRGIWRGKKILNPTQWQKK